jgi:Fic family protein
VGDWVSLNQKNFCDVCEFFSMKYSEYKNILVERQNKYNEAFTIIDKVKALMERANQDIEEANPKKAELDKFNEEQKKILAEKQKIKNAGRTKKANLDKVVAGLNTQLKEQQSQLEKFVKLILVILAKNPFL